VAVAKKRARDDLEQLGRFSEPALLILISLAAGPKHGYAMTTDIESLTGAKLGPGTLYGALSRLEARGLVEALPVEDRRRPYRISGAGAHVLRARLADLATLARAGQRRLVHS
jgi:DNA-binding PadR family transcriptional regulator